MTRPPLRVGCVQYDPKLGDVGGNIARVKELTANLSPNELDLLVLPEMALTGYCFKSASEITPYLESQRGPTFELCSDLAKRLGCYVVAGYPERLPQPGDELAPEGHSLPASMSGPPGYSGSRSASNAGADGGSEHSDGVIVTEAPEAQLAIPPPSDEHSDAPPSFDEAMAFPREDMSQPPDADARRGGMTGDGKEGESRDDGKDGKSKNVVGYNSALLVSPTSHLLGNYRKSFLYTADLPWAASGPGFRFWDLPPPLGRTVLAICMDLNPRDFIAPWNAYELATFVKSVQAETVVLPMNWLEPELDEDEEDMSEEERMEVERLKGGESPCLPNLNYWAARLSPLHDPSPLYSRDDGGVSEVGSGAGRARQGGEGNGGRGGSGDGQSGDKSVVFIACNRTGTERGTTFSGSSAVMRFGPGVELVEAFSRAKEGVMIAHVL